MSNKSRWVVNPSREIGATSEFSADIFEFMAEIVGVMSKCNPTGIVLVLHTANESKSFQYGCGDAEFKLSIKNIRAHMALGKDSN